MDYWGKNSMSEKQQALILACPLKATFLVNIWQIQWLTNTFFQEYDFILCLRLGSPGEESKLEENQDGVGKGAEQGQDVSWGWGFCPSHREQWTPGTPELILPWG